MDTDFEARLLKFIDDFLASGGGVDQFHQLEEALGSYYFEKGQSVLKPIEARYPKPVFQADESIGQEYRRWEGYAESKRAYQAQMPQDRRWFFMRVVGTGLVHHAGGS